MLDECDKCLDKLDMRKDVRQIFVETTKRKQVGDVQRNDDLGDPRSLQEVHFGPA